MKQIETISLKYIRLFHKRMTKSTSLPTNQLKLIAEIIDIDIFTRYNTIV